MYSRGRIRSGSSLEFAMRTAIEDSSVSAVTGEDVGSG